MTASFRRPLRALCLAAAILFMMSAAAFAGRCMRNSNIQPNGGGIESQHPGCVFLNADPGDLERLKRERDNFVADTTELTRFIYQKQLELKSILAQKDPDPAEAKKVLKEISDADSQYSEKRLEHLFRMKEIDPSLFRSPGYCCLQFGAVDGGCNYTNDRRPDGKFGCGYRRGCGWNSSAPARKAGCPFVE